MRRKITHVTRAIREFLESERNDCNRDLLDRYLSFDGMETQVNMHPADGWIVTSDKGKQFTNGLERWWDIRIPKHANSEPVWGEYSIDWRLRRIVDAIGSTGWCWKERVSKWVAFDFDGLTHGAGLSDTQLDAVRDAAFSLPYVEVRKSSSGSGYHLYVMLDSIPTKNHTEHAVIGKRVLKKMSADAGFDFSSYVDTCGGNFWIWSRKATAENGGFSLIKGATA